MRRIYFPAVLLLSFFLLASCGNVRPLEPREVLKRSIIRSSSIDSASISASVFMQLNGYASFSGSAVVQGVIRGNGSWSGDITFQGRDSNGSGTYESGNVSIMSVDGSQIFVKPDSLQGPMLEIYKKSLTGSLNGWWYIGKPSSLPAAADRHTLSPAELKEMADAFVITSSSGPEEIARRRMGYRISVSLSEDAVRNLFGNFAKENTHADGILWIDANDFTLVRATWNLRNLVTTLGLTDLSIDVALADVNKPVMIIPPTGSASALPLNGVFATISL